MIKRYLNRIRLYPIQNACRFPQELWRFWGLILPYLQASEAAGHGYMHAGRNTRLLGQRQDFITHNTASSMSISIFVCPPCLPSPTGAMQQAQIDATYTVGLFHSWETQGQVFFEQAENILANCKRADPPSTGEQAVTWLSRSGGLGLLSCLCE